jgi:TP901 family phage tail tape measure protein
MSRVRGGQVFIEIGADPRRLFKSLQDLNKHIGKIGSQLQGLGTRMTAFGAALAAPLALATRQFATFDDAIRATAAVSGASGTALQSLNDKARQLGATTSFTAVQVANLMTELGRAGFRPDEIEAMTGAVLDLARATGTDATLASGIMAATLRQFALGATDAARAADVLTYTANKTFNTVEGLGESLKYAGPVAKSLGMSLEDTVSILGALGNVGIQGSEAGTALRRLGVISAASGQELQALFGVTNTDAAGNLKPLVQILDEINTATADMSVADRTSRMAKAFGLLGITSANVLSGSASTVRDLRDGMNDLAGVANKTAKEMDAGLGGSFRIATSAIEGTSLAIGDALAPGLQKLVGFVTNAAGSLTSFVKANQGVIVSVAKGIALFGAAGLAALTLGTAVSVLSAAVGTLIAASTALLAPLVAVAASLTGLLLAFAAATVKVLAYGTASVAAATAATAAWLAANAAMLGMVGFLGLIAVNILGVLGGMEELGHASRNVAQAGRDAMSVFASMGKTADQTFRGIADSLNSNNAEGALAVGMAGLKAVFTRGSSAFMNAVDEWGVNLVNTFDFYISQIPFLRFLGKDSYKFSVFGDSTDGNNADTRADARGAALGDRQQQRTQGEQDVFRDFNNTLGDVRLTNSLRRQSRDLEGAINTAATNEELRQLGFALTKLKDSGRVAADEIEKLEKAYDAAAEKIAAPLPKSPAGQPGRGGGGLSSAGLSDDGLASGMGGLVSDEAATNPGSAKSVFEQQADEVLKTLSDSWSAADVRNAIGEAQALIQTQAVSRSVASQLQSAMEAAGKLVDPKSLEDETRRQMASPAEVVGTFSGAALGQMGFGQNLAQRMVDEQKKTNFILNEKLGPGRVGD